MRPWDGIKFHRVFGFRVWNAHKQLSDPGCSTHSTQSTILLHECSWQSPENISFSIKKKSDHMGWRKRNFFRKHFLSHRNWSMTLKPRLIRKSTHWNPSIVGGWDGACFPLEKYLRVNFKLIVFITNSLSNTYANFAKIPFFGMKWVWSSLFKPLARTMITGKTNPPPYCIKQSV